MPGIAVLVSLFFTIVAGVILFVSLFCVEWLTNLLHFWVNIESDSKTSLEAKISQIIWYVRLIFLILCFSLLILFFVLLKVYYDGVFDIAIILRDILEICLKTSITSA